MDRLKRRRSDDIEGYKGVVVVSDARATNDNKAVGTDAEEYIARKTGGERHPNEWYDVESGNGRIIEVKSTQETVNDTPATTTDPRNGRFRLWQHQHEKLKDAEGVYYFLVDGLPTTRVKPEKVDRVMNARGLSWTDSGASTDNNQQVKINWSYLIDPGE